MLKGGLYAPDGLVRTTFKHDPSTLRLSSARPNLQNIPLAIRRMFVAPPGWTFWARDYRGIEAILVGWFAGSRRYIRLASIDIHSFFTAYALYELDKVLTIHDLPSESSSDADLTVACRAIKQAFPAERETNKRLVHGGNYRMGPYEAQDVILRQLGRVVPQRDIKRLFAFYWQLFPEIPCWHRRVTGVEPCQGESVNAAKGWLRTPFGNIHRFYDAVNHAWTPDGWDRVYGSDAKRAIASGPQASARFVLTRAAQRLPRDVQDTLRLLIHDEMLGLCPVALAERCLQGSQQEMEAPVPELQGLVIGTEAKVGPCWGKMQPC